MKRKPICRTVLITLLTCLSVTTFTHTETLSEASIQLTIDGENMTEQMHPIQMNRNIMIPVQAVSEQVGVDVIWDEENQTVTLTKGDDTILLWLNSRLVKHQGGTWYSVMDVVPQMIDGHMYIPASLLSNSFEISTMWDDQSQTLFLETTSESPVELFYDMQMTNVSPGGVITEKAMIELSFAEAYKNQAEEVDLLLLNPDTARGFIVAREGTVTNQIEYLPKVEDQGMKVLVAVLYDAQREIVAGTAMPVYIDVQPRFSLFGVTDSVTTDDVTLSQNLNFLAKSITYEFTNANTGEVTTVSDRDPFGTYNWKPSNDQEGLYTMRATAYDGNGNGYVSNTLSTTFEFEEYLALSGVKEGMTITKPVSLIASRNFDVAETEYLIRDYGSTDEVLISKIPYGAYTWTPTEEMAGDKELYVRVKDIYGQLRTSAPVRVTVDASPHIYLQGVGPKQVLTGEASLSVGSNVNLESVNYVLVNQQTGSKRYLATGVKSDETVTYTPLSEDEGNVSIQAEGIYQGNILQTEEIALKVYLGALYGPKAVVEKSEFLNLASGLATDSFQKTGMSASLQTAQAILETGWGQSLPVDKYSGKFSYNLFGIKGSATNGSVVCNTWEVYNGTKFRVDANFRAYYNVNESWADHKRILLELSRYEQFRDVMYDSTMGAWAIRRAGYATDPKYPMKLMNIIDQYDLTKLDEVGIGD